MKVICIDASNKPAKIPINEWIEEGVIYNVREVKQLGLQPGKFGYMLEEVELSPSSFPYETYAAERFAIVMNILEAEGQQMVYAEEPDLINI